jgi:hypothetical protein
MWRNNVEKHSFGLYYGLYYKKKFNFYTLFGSKESEWMESIEDGKFIGKPVSTVWLLH